MKTKKRLSFFALDALDGEFISGPAKDELDRAILKQLHLTQLEKTIGLLKEDECLLLILNYADGLKIEELSEMTGLGNSAIKMRFK